MLAQIPSMWRMAALGLCAPQARAVALIAPAEVPQMTSKGLVHGPLRSCATSRNTALSTPAWYAARAPPPVRTRAVREGADTEAWSATASGTGSLLRQVGIHHGERRHVDDAPHGRAGCQHIDGGIGSQQHRSHGDIAAGRSLQEVIGNVSRL